MPCVRCGDVVYAVWDAVAPAHQMQILNVSPTQPIAKAEFMLMMQNAQFRLRMEKKPCRHSTATTEFTARAPITRLAPPKPRIAFQAYADKYAHRLCTDLTVRRLHWPSASHCPASPLYLHWLRRVILEHAQIAASCLLFMHGVQTQGQVPGDGPSLDLFRGMRNRSLASTRRLSDTTLRLRCNAQRTSRVRYTMCTVRR